MNCINIESLEYKKLSNLSGIPMGIINYKIRQFQSDYNTDQFPPLELVMTSSEAKTRVTSMLDAKSFKNNYKISDDNINKVLVNFGINDDLSFDKLAQFINNTFKNIKIEKISNIQSINGSKPEVEFSIKEISTKYDTVKNDKTLDKFDVLKLINTSHNLTLKTPDPIYTIGEWKVYNKNNKFGITKGLYNHIKYKYNSESDAINEANDLFKNDKEIASSTYVEILKNNKNIFRELNRKGKIKIKINSDVKLSELSLYDVDLPNFTLSNKIDNHYSINSSSNVIKSNLSYDEFMNDIEGNNKALNRKVYEELSNQGYTIDNIKTIIDNNSKILLYNLLKVKYYKDNPDAYQQFTRTPHIETRAPYDVIASKYALDILSGDHLNTKVSLEENENGKYITLDTKKELNLYELNNNTKSDKDNIINLLINISDNYGIKYNLITTEELTKPEWSNYIGDAQFKKAFIYNGEIYVNMDNASLTDPIHELSHLFLGSLKQKNPKLYQSYIDKIYELPDYVEKQKRYNNLTENDKNEEIFIETFSEYLNNSYSNQSIINWIESDKTLFYEHQNFIDKLLDVEETTTNEPSRIIGSMSLKDVMNTFGTAIKKGNISQVLNSDFSKLSRQMRNLKERLLKDNELIENCF